PRPASAFRTLRNRAWWPILARFLQGWDSTPVFSKAFCPDSEWRTALPASDHPVQSPLPWFILTSLRGKIVTMRFFGIGTRIWMLLAALCLLFFPFALSAEQYDPLLYQELHWRMIGPFRGGRTVAISGVPGQPNIFYMAPNNGGVWKTTDFGHTWNPIFDNQPNDNQSNDAQESGSIGALAVAPSNPNTIYVGSGEGLRRPDLSVGNGIYKSTDAGRTWQHLGQDGSGLRDAQQISSIIVDPKDANRLFVAAQGHPYGPNPERGIFRSLDGGQTFQKVLYKDENVGGMDLVFDPRNSQIIFASMWASRRPPWTTGGGYTGQGSGLYKSTDGGNTWRQLTKGLPGEAEGIGRIGPAVSPSDPDRMYAWVNAKKGGGIYRSDDAGESWQQVNDEDRVWG